jgi:hypothetical protein
MSNELSPYEKLPSVFTPIFGPLHAQLLLLSSNLCWIYLLLHFAFSYLYKSGYLSGPAIDILYAQVRYGNFTL